MKIAIDGPSASGKGTISKILAKELGAIYLNTGKIYRIVALLASKQKGNLMEAATKICQNIEKYFIEESENDEIYTEENARLTSEIAKIPEVRSGLLEFQKSFAAKNDNVILEGRDIGTVIMPNADFKFYLDASPEERARRRLLQSGSGNINEIMESIQERDKNDSERKEAALKIADDAIYIDTTKMSVEEVVNKILNIVNGL